MSIGIRIAVAKNQRGNLEGVTLARDEDSKDARVTLWRYTPTGSGVWGGGGGLWERLSDAGQISFQAPAVARNADGRLEAVLSGGPIGGIWHGWQITPGSEIWRGWHSLGEPPEPVTSQLALVPNKDGRLELFTLDFHAAVWHAWQTTPGDDWTGWHSLGTPSDGVSLMSVDPPVVARNEDGRLELFMRGNDEELWHCWQREAGSRPWAAWSPLGSPSDQLKLSGPPMVERNRDGRLEVFAQASDGEIWHRWQQAAGADRWAAWSRLGTIEGSGELSVGVGAHADGQLALFAVRTDTDNVQVQERHQTAPNNGWSAWKAYSGDLPGRVADMRVLLDGGGTLHVLLRNLTSGGLCHIDSGGIGMVPPPPVDSWQPPLRPPSR
jgi:hypothetical protein